MKSNTTMDKDSIANVATLTATGFSLANFEMMLTVVVLFTALALNIVRIYYTIKEKNK
jgi:hypothetical protein